MLKHVDICSGIGGFSLAAGRAGLRTVQFVEVEPYCQAVLRKHWPEIPVHDDIRTFDAKPYRGQVYLLTAGFPCQDVSAAGRGEGLSGKKSSLWWQVRRVIRECKPVFCLIENVPMLKHRGIDTVLRGLERAGYACSSFVVGASDTGAPHRRKRVWIVGMAYSNAPEREEPARHKPDAQKHQAAGRGRKSMGHRNGLSPFPPGRSDFEAWGQVERMDASLMPCTECEVYGVADGVSSRMVRRRRGSRSAALKGLGNAIVPEVAFQFIRAILECDPMSGRGS